MLPMSLVSVGGAVAAAAVLIAAASARAQRANVSDIAVCNEQAQARSGSPSASPGPPPLRDAPPDSTRAPGASGGVTVERPGRATAERDRGDAPTLTPKPGTQTDPSGSIVTRSPDPLLDGMATGGLDDPAYRTAYRECMAERLKARP